MLLSKLCKRIEGQGICFSIDTSPGMMLSHAIVEKI